MVMHAYKIVLVYYLIILWIVLISMMYRLLHVSFIPTIL